MNKRVIITFLSALIIILGTIIAIRFAEGYRPSPNGTIEATGLLNANSSPTGSSVYINGNLTSATDTTLNLAPGNYSIEIRKDGYFPWKKEMHIEKELVTQTNTLLFPTAPSLTPLTYAGALNVTPSPDGQRLLFSVASASASTKNGLFVLDMTDNPLALQKGPRQIATQTNGWNFDKAHLLWSPNSDKILVSQGNRNILLDPNRFNDIESTPDISISLKDTLSIWEEQLYQRERQQLLRFPLEVIRIATQSAKNVYISPDGDKVLYTATASATIPDNLIPAVPAASTQVQHRSILAGNVYVYDKHEDRNFLISQEPLKDSPVIGDVVVLADDLYTNARTLVASPSAFTRLQDKDMGNTVSLFSRHYSGLYSPTFQWLPDSSHLISINGSAMNAVEYDGTNQVEIYAGPFSDHFVYPWPNGTKLVILTNFNQPGDIPLNLYALGIK